MNFNYEATPQAPLYVAVPGHAASLGNTEIAYQVTRDGTVHVMSADVHAALDACRAFRTLEAHQREVLKRLPALSNRTEAVRAVLDQLVRMGLLVDSDAWFAAVHRDVPADVAEFRAVFVRAVDAARIAATFDSIARYEKAHGPNHRYVVIEDGAGVAAVESAIEAANAQSRPLATTIVDEAFRHRLVDRLASNDADRAALAAALGTTHGETTWHAFNVAALLGAGARFAWLDDGARLDAHIHGDTSADLGIERPGAATLDLAPNRGAALGAGQAVPLDPIATALEFCGATLGRALSASRERALRRTGIEGARPDRLPLDASMRIGAVDAGHRGAPVRPGALFLYRMRGVGRERLWRDESLMRAQLDRPAVIYTVAQPTVMRAQGPIPFVIDASHPLPPLVAGAEEAGLFGSLARATRPGELSLQLPITIGRDDDQSSADLQRAYTPNAAAFIAHVARRAANAFRAEDAALRYQQLATLFRDVAASSERERLALLNAFVSDERSAHLLTLQEALAASDGAPPFWNAGLRDAVMTNGRTLMSYTPPRLADWPESTTEAQAAERIARVANDYADLCAHWPVLVARAASAGGTLLDHE